MWCSLLPTSNPFLKKPSLSQNHQNRQHTYRQIRQILVSLLPLSTSQLSQEDLDKRKIQCLPMDSDPEKQNSDFPLYCTPLSSTAYDSIFASSFDPEDEYMTVPEWPECGLNTGKRYYTALQIGRTLRDYLGSSSYPCNMLSKTQWIERW